MVYVGFLVAIVIWGVSMHKGIHCLSWGFGVVRPGGFVCPYSGRKDLEFSM